MKNLALKIVVEAGIVLLVLVSVGLLILFTIYDGYVISKIWNWFMPRVMSVGKMSIATGMGLDLLILMFMYGLANHKLDNDRNKAIEIFYKKLFSKPVIASFALLFAYIVSKFQ
jgi:hypothetical protein